MSSNRLFISLKTKIAIASLGVIFALSATRLYVSYLSSIQIHKDSAESRTDQLEKSFMNLADRSGLQLERLASQLNPDDFLNESTADDQHRLSQHLYSGIESVQFFSTTGAILKAWNIVDTRFISDSRVSKNAIERIQNNGMPIHFIACAKTCIQSAYVPIITKGSQEIIVHVTRSIGDLALDFKSISKSDIIIFANNDNSKNWFDKHIEFATNPELTPHILFELGQRKQLTDETPHFFGKINNSTIAAKKIQFDGFINASPIAAILLLDVSQSADFIIVSAKRQMQITLIFLIITAIAIWLVLHRPLRDIANLAAVLPKLAQGDYLTVQNVLSGQRRSFIHDELTQLQTASVKLSHELQGLEYLSNKRLTELHSTILELENAEKFSQVMADSCPIVIALHKPTGELLRLNLYGREKLGISTQDIETQKYFFPLHDPSQWQSTMDRVMSGSIVHSEGSIPSSDNKPLEFLWLYTKLQKDGKNIVLSVGMDITERKRNQAQLTWLHEHDGVTGLMNRQRFTYNVEQLLASSRQSSQSVLILAIDIVDFSEFNELNGFVSGDKLLHHVAETLEKCTPKSAVCCRVQGDQFCIYSLSSDPKTLASNIYQKLTAANTKEYPIQFTAAALLNSKLHANGEELISNVLEALYAVKTQSPGTLQYLSDEHFNRNVRLENKYSKENLYRAFEQNRFVLFYQPILNTQTGIISHCESLVRMLADDGSILLPFQFLDTAKRFGQMPRLDMEVLRMAMIQQQRWEQSGKDIKLSINITAPTFEEPNFIERFREMLASTGANPNKLIFEIVETDAIISIEKTQILADAIKSYGAEIAFDDFGVGFTSFEYLRELPVDYIKIDRSFIRQLAVRKEDALLVQSMVNMAKALNKKVIAEGVEDKKTALQLIDMGVDFLQGYYFARPSPETNLDLNRHAAIWAPQKPALA